MNTKHTFSIERGQCSFYRNVRVKENVVMQISEFVKQIRNGKWKNEVASYRQLMREGNAEAAGRIKSNLPAILVAGRCEGGHTKANFRKFSGELVIDVDGCNERTPEMLQCLKAQPWTRAGWISVSDNGFKVVVRVDAETPYEFEKLAYPQVLDRVQELIGFPVDKQCKDLTRMCYVSWDEDAFYNEDCEAFPWQESGVENPSVENPSVAGGFISRFFEKFCATHSFVPGSRHDFLLKLGASAYRNGFNSVELKELIGLAEDFCYAPDYLPGEIHRNIIDSYRLTEKRSNEAKDRSGVKVQGEPPAPVLGNISEKNDRSEWDSEDDDKEEERKERNRLLRYNAPYLPDWIFESLPDILKQGVGIAKNLRQRDMVLLSMLTNLSACMPKVRLKYDDEYVYPHLFLVVVASSAAGKGIMKNAGKLSWIIQRELDRENQRKQKEYENAMMAWEMERLKAMKGHRTADLDACPEPALRETLQLSVDMSRNQLIRLMAGSPNGVLLNTSELDTLRTAVNAEYGRFDDLMRACFHHETFGSDFKSDKRPYTVQCPKMAFCGSGTPNQFYRLCPSTENGAYSRYLIYMAEQDADFQLMAPRGERQDKDMLFRKLSEKTYRYYKFLKEHATEVKFTTGQWDLHQSFFQGILQQVKMEEVEAPVSVVFRYGLIASRIAMAFTALRKAEAEWTFHDVFCTDDDFILALAITEVLVSHSLTLATSMHKIKSSPSEMRPYFRVRAALEKLKSEFSYTDLVSALVSEGFSASTAKRYRNRLLSLKIIEKQGDIYSFCSRKWRVKLEKSSLGKV